MAITPSGSASWTRTADHTIYGGSPTKANWQAQGVTNPDTDIDAADYCRMAEDTAAAIRVADFGWAVVVCDDATPANPTVGPIAHPTAYSASTYAGATPGGDFPTVTRVADGHIKAVWSATLTDAYGVSAYVDLAGGTGDIQGSTSGRVTAVASDPNADGYNEQLDFYFWDSAGAALTSATALIKFK